MVLLRKTLPSLGLDDARIMAVAGAAKMGAATFFTGLSAIAGEVANMETAMLAERRLLAGYSAEVGVEIAGDGRTDIGAIFFEAKRATLTAGLAEQSLSTLSLSAGAAVPTAEAVFKAEEGETGPAPRVRV
jgi:hypothetical protein